MRWLLACSAGLAVASLVLALLAHFPAFWPLLLLPLIAAAAVWARSGEQARYLRWDGQAWHLHAVVKRGPALTTLAQEETVPVRLEILFDFGFWMLLRALPSPGRPWPAWTAGTYLSLFRSNHLGNWTPLRAVLYGSRPSLD